MEINIGNPRLMPSDAIQSKAAELLKSLEAGLPVGRGLTKLSQGFQELSLLAQSYGNRRVACVSSAFFGIMRRMARQEAEDLPLVLDTAAGFLGSLSPVGKKTTERAGV